MADDIIKSAREIALEKIEKIGEATEEERLGWKYTPEGEKLAGKYLKDDPNMVAELGKYEENVRKIVIGGAAGVLTRNIDMPVTEAARKNTRRAMEGLKLLKNDKVGLENIYSKIRYLFNHYEEDGEKQRQQAFQSLKAEMEAKIQQAMQQQGNSMMGNINVESQPQFQQEWRKIQNQLDTAYQGHLNEYKHELSEID